MRHDQQPKYATIYSLNSGIWGGQSEKPDLLKNNRSREVIQMCVSGSDMEALVNLVNKCPQSGVRDMTTKLQAPRTTGRPFPQASST